MALNTRISCRALRWHSIFTFWLRFYSKGPFPTTWQALNTRIQAAMLQLKIRIQVVIILPSTLSKHLVGAQYSHSGCDSIVKDPFQAFGRHSIPASRRRYCNSKFAFRL